MKPLYDTYKEGWWVKVSPLAGIAPETWICSIYKKGKASWITEQCREFNTPREAYEWAFEYIDSKTRQELFV